MGAKSSPLKSSMPIRPEYKWFYPIDWPQLSAVIRFERAKGRCERCGRPHGREVQHLGDGRWWDEDEWTWRNACGRRLARRVGGDIAVRTTMVVLAAAHLDHDPTNNRLRNLKALCQRCHMLHDHDAHWRRRLLTLRMRNAIGDLFLGLYQRNNEPPVGLGRAVRARRSAISTEAASRPRRRRERRAARP